EQTQTQLEQTQTQLEQTQTQLEQTQIELQQFKSQLQYAKITITEMESSKFWKLRSIVLKLIGRNNFLPNQSAKPE
ncbi:MAG: hypothetical protein IGS39_19585, partial [Calothrix sp. C42_A2020_038]|nr:hypothetical protein [Calothrix sp. C42_A2020_038]